MIMAPSGLISNARGTGVLGHVIVNGRKVQRSDLPTNHPAAAAPRAAVTNLPALNRGDEEGLAAAMLMTARQIPSEIHSLRSLKRICRQYGTNPLAHQYVKANIWEHSTMVASVDLRDREDLPRCIDGDALISGAFFTDAEVASNTRRIRLTIWIEIPGNRARTLEILEMIVDMCPQLQRIDIDITTESEPEIAEIVACEVCAFQEAWRCGRQFRATCKASVVDADE